MRPTTDLCDDYADRLQIAAPVFRDFGGVSSFFGPIVTVRTFEDNTRVRALLETPGAGRVLVVDGGGSLAHALIGGNLARLGEDNGWAGAVVNGAIRDVVELEAARFGVKALAAIPLKSKKEERGSTGEVIGFAGVTFHPGHFLYADRDGIVVSEMKLD